MTEYDCQETKRHVHEYLQQELTEQELTDITSHLAGCDSCEEEYDFEVLFTKVIQRSCTDVPPQELADQILSKIRQTLEEGHQA